MAASVQNRQYAGLEPPINGIIRTFKPGRPNHRSDSPLLTYNNFKSDREMTWSKKPQPLASEIYSSSDDEQNDVDDLKLLIHKVNSEVEPSSLDSRDEETADNWIERNASMVRLTGKHPFNSEPPLARLMHYGFITPVPLHYVRNHGPVPQGRWEDWTVEVCGLVKGPARFTMEELVNDFPSREFPVTLACAGNRRREQNMVKQSIGFNCY